MSTPFLAEIRVFSFNFPPKGWALCNGQLLPINQNQALFSLLGTTYGGNGQTNFGLPDFRSRLPLHVGLGFTQGQKAGEESHTLIASEMPQHTHLANATNGAATTGDPTGAVWAVSGHATFGPAPNVLMEPATVTNVGGNQSHENRSPFLVLNFCIALQGIFPSQN